MNLFLLGSAIWMAFAFCVFLSYLGGWLMRFWAPSIQFVDPPRRDRHSQRPVALGGGIPWLGSLIFILFVGSLLVVLDHLPEELSIHRLGLMDKMSSVGWICLGAVALHLLGLADDFKPLSQGFKLSIQIIVASFIFWFVPETRITVFISSDVVSFGVTVLWIVTLVNCFNLLDHADGVSSITAIAVFLGMVVLAVIKGQLFVALLSLLLIGCLLGFLWHNFPPARLFMGDAGSLPLGYFVAIVTAIFTFYSDREPLTAALTPLCLLLVPVYDSWMVIRNRWRQGQPIWQGDRQHIAHRFHKKGWAPQVVLGMLFLVTLLGAAMACLATFLVWPYGLIPITLSFLGIGILWKFDQRL